jgi:hypothetical protein
VPPQPHTYITLCAFCIRQSFLNLTKAENRALSHHRYHGISEPLIANKTFNIISLAFANFLLTKHMNNEIKTAAQT